MALTIKQSFKEYSSNLNITDKQEEAVSNCRANVVREINKVLYLNESGYSYLIGSYDRNTLTRYLKEGDVDVMIVLHFGKHKAWYTSEGTVSVLDKFKDILSKAYPDTSIRRDRNCITMQLSRFRLDVVPAFKHTNGYFHIPDSVNKKWIDTDPSKFAKQITQVNKNMDETFIPLIKMVKGWNREIGWLLRSFHIECIMNHRYKNYTEGYSYSSMLYYFFQSLPGYVSSAMFDPIMGDRVDGYLDNVRSVTDRTLAIQQAQKAAKIAEKAFQYEQNYPDTPEYAIREWKELLGEFFPAYG